MRRRILAQQLIERLNGRIKHQLNLNKTLILGVVLKGLPVAYSIAKINELVENFVPIVAQRHIYMQHHVESYFPSLEWKDYFCQQLSRSKNLLIVDDVVNTGFTKQRVESVVHSLDKKEANRQRFAALVLNRRNLANQKFVHICDLFAAKVNAREVECDWGLITVPLLGLSVEEALGRCEEYFQRFWVNEKRVVSITY